MTLPDAPDWAAFLALCLFFAALMIWAGNLGIPAT